MSKGAVRCCTRLGCPEIHENRETFAYRGYLVTRNPFSGVWYVSKDGAHISSAESDSEAKRTIDTLV
jgi:hypothetical protein